MKTPLRLSLALEQLEELRTQHPGALVPIYTELLGDLETPISAYRKVAIGEYTFLLESVEGGERFARYSFIGIRPEFVLRFEQGMVYRVQRDAAGRYHETAASCHDPLEIVAQEMSRYPAVTVPGLPRFTGGAVGYLGYDAIRHFEPRIKLPEQDDLGLPEALFCFTHLLLAFDHVQHRIKIIAHVPLDAHLADNFRKAESAIAAIAATLQADHGPPPSAPALPTPRHKKSPQGIRDEMASLRATYLANVGRAKAYIQAGDIFQVVLSQRFKQPTAASSLSIYRALRAINPSPYMFLFDLPGFSVIGASPEVLVRVEDRTMLLRPIAGTRPRGSDAAADARLEHELRTDEKEQAEHIMLVDLGRNDVGRVSLPGTVRVEELMVVERYSHVMHLVSQVCGTLRGGLSMFDALRAAFPAGTLSGAPKIRAMEIISELESQRRCLYGGAVGYCGYNGNLDMAIAIRTMILKDGCAYLQTGAGIVADSDAEAEYQETLNKARVLFAALDQAEEIEEVAHALTTG